MKKPILISLVTLFFSSAFAESIELPMQSNLQEKMKCELYLVKADVPNQNDSDTAIEILFSKTIEAKENAGMRTISFVSRDDRYNISLVMREFISSGKGTTQIRLNDLVTGLSAEISTSSIQKSGGITATIASTPKLKVFDDAQNSLLTLSCE